MKIESAVQVESLCAIFLLPRIDLDDDEWSGVSLLLGGGGGFRSPAEFLFVNDAKQPKMKSHRVVA